MDTQCNTTSKLLPANTHIKKGLFEILDPDEKLVNSLDYIYPTTCKKVSMIPNISNTGVLEPDLIINGSKDNFYRLRNYLNGLKNYDIALIDCPPNMGSFVLISLYASTHCLVPVNACSADSVEGLINALDLVKSIREKANPKLQFLRILINRMNKRKSVCSTIKDQLVSTYKDDMIFENIIPDATLFEKAEIMQKTIFQYEQTARPTTIFRNLAKEVIKILKV